MLLCEPAGRSACSFTAGIDIAVISALRRLSWLPVVASSLAILHPDDRWSCLRAVVAAGVEGVILPEYSVSEADFEGRLRELATTSEIRASYQLK